MADATTDKKKSNKPLGVEEGLKLGKDAKDAVVETGKSIGALYSTPAGSEQKSGGEYLAIGAKEVYDAGKKKAASIYDTVKKKLTPEPKK